MHRSTIRAMPLSSLSKPKLQWITLASRHYWDGGQHICRHAMWYFITFMHQEEREAADSSHLWNLRKGVKEASPRSKDKSCTECYLKCNVFTVPSPARQASQAGQIRHKVHRRQYIDKNYRCPERIIQRFCRKTGFYCSMNSFPSPCQTQHKYTHKHTYTYKYIHVHTCVRICIKTYTHSCVYYDQIKC